VTCDRSSVVPSTNKTDHNDKTEKCLQVILNTINQNPSTLKQKGQKEKHCSKKRYTGAPGG
jgi:hypothetical protein